MSLYAFENLDRRLDELGFPKIHAGSGFQIIKGIDFEKAYKEGSISFGQDGVYLEYEGKSYRGYMFIKEPWIEKYGNYPKFHLTKCRTVKEFISSGRFKIRYEWSNSDVNDLIDKSSNNSYKDEVIEYCANCRKNYNEGISNTKDFFESLDKSEMEEENIEVDMFGYVRGIQKITREYNRSRNYTCESCFVKPKSNLHRRWWHTHYIDGDKTNVNKSNLKCLCIKCMSRIDQEYKKSLSRATIKKQLEHFKMEY